MTMMKLFLPVAAASMFLGAAQRVSHAERGALQRRMATQQPPPTSTSPARSQPAAPPNGSAAPSTKPRPTKMTTDAGCPALTDALPLTGTPPYAVSVKIDSAGVPVFYATGDAAGYHHLAASVDKTQTSLQVAFTFLQGSQITSLSPITAGLTFANVVSGTQQGTVQAVGGAFQDCYHFDVNTTLQSLDPVIVISVRP